MRRITEANINTSEEKESTAVHKERLLLFICRYLYLIILKWCQKTQSDFIGFHNPFQSILYGSLMAINWTVVYCDWNGIHKKKELGGIV